MDCNGPNSVQTPEMDDVLSFVATGNAVPLLHEIKHALTRLLDDGSESIIDLGAIPFAPGDERVLDNVLGVGEVQATLTIMGESHVRETTVPGVWRVDHLDENAEFQSRFIEITFLPKILKSQREDVERGVETLSERLDALDGN